MTDTTKPKDNPINSTFLQGFIELENLHGGCPEHLKAMARVLKSELLDEPEIAKAVDNAVIGHSMRNITYTRCPVYTEIPISMREVLTGTVGSVYHAIMHGLGSGYLWQCKIEDLAAAAGISIHSAKDAITKMINIGAIAVYKEKSSRGRQSQPRIYMICPWLIGNGKMPSYKIDPNNQPAKKDYINLLKEKGFFEKRLVEWNFEWNYGDKLRDENTTRDIRQRISRYNINDDGYVDLLLNYVPKNQTVITRYIDNCSYIPKDADGKKKQRINSIALASGKSKDAAKLQRMLYDVDRRAAAEIAKEKAAAARNSHGNETKTN
ncbi:MAG: hypothetical protein LIO81_05460 [Clostridiales bacterium]|nr:hypothetical protein [Clostridiales bacterium]